MILDPHKLDDVVLSSANKKAFLGFLTGKIDTPALLISGPTGCGKSTLATLLAASFFCTGGGKEGEPCGKCNNCLKLLDYSCDVHNTFLAVFIHKLNGASARKIDDVRELVERVKQPSLAPNGKVLIWIDEAHQLTEQAVKSLLVPMETRLPWRKWVFTTSEPEKLSKEFVDRCWHIKLLRPNAKAKEEFLTKHPELQPLATHPAWAAATSYRELVRLAQGSELDIVQETAKEEEHPSYFSRLVSTITGQVDKKAFAQLREEWSIETHRRLCAYLTVVCLNNPQSAVANCLARVVDSNPATAEPLLCYYRVVASFIAARR